MNWRENARQRTDRLPLAYRLRDDLLELLADEQYGANAQLPSEKELSSQFSVSRSTVREALKLLEEERLIYCIHGVGRFMAPEPISMLKGDIVRLESVSEMAARLGYRSKPGCSALPRCRRRSRWQRTSGSTPAILSSGSNGSAPPAGSR